MERLSAPAYGVAEYAAKYKRVKVTAKYETYIDVPVEDDEYEAIEEVVDNLDLSDFDYDYEVMGEKSEIFMMYEA